MSLNASNIQYKGNSNRTPQDVLPIGTYPARLVGVIGYGLQAQPVFDKKEEAKQPLYELKLVYELTNSFMKDEDGNDIPDKPRWVWCKRKPIYFISDDASKRNESKSYNTKQYNALDPQFECGGDFGALVGRSCLLTITHDKGKGVHAGKTFANATGFAPMMAGMSVPELVNEPFVFDPNNPDMEVWERISDKEKDVIKQNLEYNGSMLQSLVEGTSSSPAPVTSAPSIPADDDVPF